ncbi:hypothetical protein ACQPZJ_35620 [Actinoplanes sp. CA-054009]
MNLKVGDRVRVTVSDSVNPPSGAEGVITGIDMELFDFWPIVVQMDDPRYADWPFDEDELEKVGA